MFQASLLEASEGILNTEGEEGTETEVQDFFTWFVSQDEDITWLNKDSFARIYVSFCKVDFDGDLAVARGFP